MIEQCVVHLNLLQLILALLGSKASGSLFLFTFFGISLRFDLDLKVLIAYRVNHLCIMCVNLAGHGLVINDPVGLAERVGVLADHMLDKPIRVHLIDILHTAHDE